MPAPLTAGLPPFFTLDNGYIVRVTAQDPTTGNTVAGVIVSNVSLAVDVNSSGAAGPLVPLSGAFLPGAA